MVGFPSAYLGDSSSQGSYARRFYLLFRLCPLNSGFLVRWSGSHGSLTVVGTSKSLMQAQHSICAFRCSPVALATPDCFLWAPLSINLFPHSRPLLIHLLLDSPPPIPSSLQWSQGTHRGLFFLTLGFILSSCVPAASGEGSPDSSACTYLSTSIWEFLVCQQAPDKTGLRNTVEEGATILCVGCPVWPPERERSDASLRAVPLFYHLALKWHAVFSLLGKCHLKNTQ